MTAAASLKVYTRDGVAIVESLSLRDLEKLRSALHGFLIDRDDPPEDRLSDILSVAIHCVSASEAT